MRLQNIFKILIGLCLALCWVVQGRANEPVFLQWLAPDDPGDMTIRAYWDQYSAEKLSPKEIVDLGTMLFSRGYPRDAERLFREAIKADKELYEAWFRLGLVEHQQGNHSAARKAYHHCLRIFKGHGWCNFYLGLLEEQEHNAKEAMKYYKKAFRYAPVLGDEKINPELRNSELALGAWLDHAREQEFHKALPMAWLAPEKMIALRREATKKAGAVEKGEQPPELQHQEAVPTGVGGSAAGGIGKIEVKQSTALKPVQPSTRGSNKNTAHRGKASRSQTSSSRRTPTPRPTPSPAAPEDAPPFGFAGDRGVSSDGYPGF